MKLLSVFLCTVLLSGCSSAPTNQVRYYQLALTEPLAELSQAPITLQLKQVQVAPFLNGTGLVLRQSAVELNIARQHLWAEPLELQLNRVLQQQLRAALPAIQFQQLPAGSLSLSIQLSQFYATEQGEAVISGFYQLGHDAAPKAQAFSYRQPLPEHGYAAMVQALSLAWQQLVTDLSEEILTLSI